MMSLVRSGFSPALPNMTFASGHVSTSSGRAISRVGSSLGFFSAAAFVRAYVAAFTDLNLIAYQTGQETKHTIVTRLRTAPRVMIRRFNTSEINKTHGPFSRIAPRLACGAAKQVHTDTNLALGNGVAAGVSFRAPFRARMGSGIRARTAAGAGPVAAPVLCPFYGQAALPGAFEAPFCAVRLSASSSCNLVRNRAAVHRPTKKGRRASARRPAVVKLRLPDYLLPGRILLTSPTIFSTSCSFSWPFLKA
jgi:hypothetical protein